jgi:hypothetical protein
MSSFIGINWDKDIKIQSGPIAYFTTTVNNPGSISRYSSFRITYSKEPATGLSGAIL